jgi:alpha-1,3-glucosyltransferase
MLELLIKSPARYPDLFPVLNVLLSTPIFGLTWLWSIKRGVEVSWAMGGLGSRNITSSAKVDSDADGSRPLAKADGVDGASGTATGIGRMGGTRTQSLGFAQGKRRPHFRTASVDHTASGPSPNIPIPRS